jgi:hypothetical protein
VCECVCVCVCVCARVCVCACVKPAPLITTSGTRCSSLGWQITAPDMCCVPSVVKILRNLSSHAYRTFSSQSHRTLIALLSHSHHTLITLSSHSHHTFITTLSSHSHRTLTTLSPHSHYILTTFLSHSRNFHLAPSLSPLLSLLFLFSLTLSPGACFQFARAARRSLSLLVPGEDISSLHH